MTTSTAKLSPGSVTNLCPGGSSATNTATVTQAAANAVIYVLLTIAQNDDADSPTVPGSATITLTIVDGASVTQLTSAAISAVGSYVFSAPVTGTFTVVSTVSIGDTDTLGYQVDAVAYSRSPFALGAGSPIITATGSENPTNPG